MTTTNIPLYIPPHRRNIASSQIWTPSLHCIPPMDEDYLASLDFFNRHLYNNSVVLRHLTHLKKIYKEDPTIEARFAERKVYNGQAPAELYLNVFTKAMQEIDSRTDFSVVSNGRVNRFLDLGCAPGGFSRWIIKNNPTCTGVGVTLPPELGGFRMEFDSPGRYKYFYQDITENLELIGCQNNDNGGIGPQFDLCIAGCMFRNPEMDASNCDAQPLWSRSRQLLRYSQLLIALGNLQEGGTLILVFNLRPHIYQVEIVCLLSCCFERLFPIKPKSVHGIRSSYYLVGVNYKSDVAQKLNILERLRTALDLVRTMDTDWDSQKPLLLEGTDDQIVKQWGSFVLEHYQVMWQAQARAIEQDLSSITKVINNRCS